MGDVHPTARKLVEADQSVQSLYGYEVISATGGVCELSLKVRPEWINGAGFTHGSVAYALMDSACAYAGASTDSLGVTTSGNITYVRGVKSGERLRTVATVKSQGRRVVSFVAEVFDSQERLIAHGAFVFQVLS